MVLLLRAILRTDFARAFWRHPIPVASAPARCTRIRVTRLLCADPQANRPVSFKSPGTNAQQLRQPDARKRLTPIRRPWGASYDGVMRHAFQVMRERR